MECNKYSKILIYADDLKLYQKIKSVEDCNRLQSDIRSVLKWSLENTLDFNLSKCFSFSFSRINKPIIFNYIMGDQVLCRIDRDQDLGVVLDKSLTFNEHIFHTVKKSVSLVGFIVRSCRSFKNYRSRKILCTNLWCDLASNLQVTFGVLGTMFIVI